MSKCQKLIEVLATKKSVLDLCLEWHIDPVFCGVTINYPATLKKLAQHALEEDTQDG